MKKKKQKINYFLQCLPKKMHLVQASVGVGVCCVVCCVLKQSIEHALSLFLSMDDEVAIPKSCM